MIKNSARQTPRKMVSYTFIACEVFVSILTLTRQSFVICDVVKTDVDNESDINYTMYSTFYYDSYQNVSLPNQDDFDFNKSSLSNTSFDVGTELESTVSVTEDSDSSLQSETNRESSFFLTPDEDICNCDLSVNVCDINCCCDRDCREEDIRIFSECSHPVSTPDENYCYQKDIILRNNTVYKMVKNPRNPMFCIVHDNFKHHRHFRDMPVLKSHRDVITVLKYKYKNTFSWDIESENIQDSREPKAGNPIYISSKKDSIKGVWSLPSPCLSDLCSCEEGVRYLVDFRSRCSHLVRDVEQDCENSALLSGTPFEDLCLQSGEDRVCALLTGERRRRPRRGEGRCEDVVTGVHFKVEQDGARGIVAISLEFLYGGVSYGRGVAVSRSFAVDFLWSNATGEGRRSGNPGYRVGRPVLAAHNESEDTSSAQEDALTVLAPDAAGLCGGSDLRRTVLFGQNLRSGCVLGSDFSDCRTLRGAVDALLLGRHGLVGVFGNANLSRHGDWIEMFDEEEGPGKVGAEGCLVSRGLRVEVVFAAVGSFAAPQYKIAGVRRVRSRPRGVDLSLARTLPLWVSVSFFDATLPAVERHAKVPSVEAHLPSDFFYPFVYGGAEKGSGPAPHLTLTLLLLLMLLLFFSIP